MRAGERRGRCERGGAGRRRSDVKVAAAEARSAAGCGLGRIHGVGSDRSAVGRKGTRRYRRAWCGRSGASRWHCGSDGGRSSRRRWHRGRGCAGARDGGRGVRGIDGRAAALGPASEAGDEALTRTFAVARLAGMAAGAPG
ncbi:hypothetical protein L1887_51197 [Cichorium endivia]|nr:hypothetical protein L1887_51197 [Cichorium endivia]